MNGTKKASRKPAKRASGRREDVMQIRCAQIIQPGQKLALQDAEGRTIFDVDFDGMEIKIRSIETQDGTCVSHGMLISPDAANQVRVRREAEWIK